MKRIKKILKVLIPVIIIISVMPFGINQWVIKSSEKYIVNEYSDMKYDAIIVLGAYVDSNGNVCDMLNDRLEVAYEYYNKGFSKKVLLSGDHGEVDYDEVNTMKKFMQDKGIKDEDIFLDHAGFSTYETMYRARDVFKAKKVLIVTQKYHLYRAIYIARQLGLDAYGVDAALQYYRGMEGYEKREFLARNKDFVTSTILKPKPTYLGEPIPISGDGRESWD